MAEPCKNIDECPVVQVMKAEVDTRLDTVTGQYEKVHESLKENSKNMQKVTIAIALQTQAVEGLVESVKEYKSENEKDHDKLELEDKALHTRITNVGTKQAEQKGLSKSNVHWKELVKIAGVFAVVSLIFKYLLPYLGG